jgi:hypothetical protein
MVDNSIAGPIAALKTKLSYVLQYYVDHSWGNNSYNANTGAADVSFPFPGIAGYAIPYAYYYHPAIGTAIRDLIAGTARATINNLAHIEDDGRVLSAYFAVWHYYGSVAAYNEGLAIAQEFVDNNMIHHDNLPYNNYNIATRAIATNDMNTWLWHAIMPILCAFLAGDAARLNKIKAAEDHLLGMANSVPVHVNADTGAAIGTDADYANSSGLEACLTAYGLTGDATFLARANLWRDKLLLYNWSAAYHMFLPVTSAGVVQPLATGGMDFEQSTATHSFVHLLRLGQIATIDDAAANIIYSRHLFQHGVRENMGYDKDYIYGTTWSSNFNHRPEFATACAMLYSLTNDEFWLRTALSYWKAVDWLSWDTYGPATTVSLDTLVKTNLIVPLHLFEFALIPIAYEKKDLTTCPISTFETPFINQAWP